MRLRVNGLLAIALGLCACARPPAVTSRPTSAQVPPLRRSLAFVNGRWFNGDGFEPRTFFSVNGVLEENAPPLVDSTIDLAGGFVIPPFGDSHTHNLDGPYRIDSVAAEYVREGTFYVQVLTNTRSGAESVRSNFNRPCALDVAWANGGITSTLSHPFLAYEPRAMGLNGTDWRTKAAEIRASRKREGDAYWFIDRVADVDAKWPLILAGHPDIIKVFLLDAREDPAVMADSGLPAGHGLRPSVVPEIVRRAHAAGLRVAAHIETSSDFEIAVRTGVDFLAHLPGYNLTQDQPDSAFLIRDDEARLAGARGVVANPTLTWHLVMDGPQRDSAGLVARRRSLARRNIETLQRAGVRMVVGSDWFGATAWPEVQALRSLGPWDNLALLRMWAVATPLAIFPQRRIGMLAEGYEASFLVLQENPLVNFDAVRGIVMRVKQGCGI
jgi:imidazolonepropionase-like amidohydrolase